MPSQTSTPASNVAHFLLEGKAPGQVAVVSRGQEYSYGQLNVASAAVARGLLRTAHGQRGDRVVLIGQNSFSWMATYLGILRAGLVCVPVSADVADEDLRYIFETTEAKLGFVHGRLKANRSVDPRIHWISDEQFQAFIDGPAQISEENTASESFDFEENGIAVQSEDLAALMFTSGSTGKPRGVMVTHGNIIANTESIVSYLGLSSSDRMMTVLPFHYCFGTSLLHTHLRVGGSLVLESRFLYPEVVLQTMQETACTGFAGVPSHFQILLRNSTLRKKTFPCLRYVQQAGGALAQSFIRELREALPHTRIYVMYGQTEATARLSYLPPEFLDQKLGSIGRGIPGVKLSVKNPSGLDVGPGEVGEIVAEGKNISPGYWRNPEDSAAIFRDGKLHTGDLAQVDEDGFIFIVDRSKDILKCGGKRASCKQIEEQLLASELLVEAAVIGIPDDILGEAVKAFVVPRARGTADIAERLQFLCKSRLPAQLIPKEIVVLASLPKNDAGKVMKQSLKNL